MKTKNKLISFISILIGVCIIFSTSVYAHTESEFDNPNYNVYTENGYINNILDFLICIFGNNKSVSDGINENYSIRPPFFLIPFRETPGFLSNIKSFLWIGTKVKVLSYSEDYTYVEVVSNNKNNGEKGYIHYLAISDNRKGELTLSRENDIVYVGQTNKGRLKATYTGNDTLTWSFEPEGYIARDEKTGVVTGIKPGIVTVTASAGNFTKSCTVSCITQWEEKETAKAKKDITVRANPGSTYPSKGTITKGATITASGDLTDGSGWIYVEGNGVYGFIHLSDFPGIDYLMTEYHYYDKGYELRFGSAESKIYEYASVMNDVMMDLFNLKICPYVSSYTSPADQCKIWRYGSVKSNNLASSCPKTGNHNSKSCLTTESLRDTLYNKGKGAGNDLIANTVWTGHIMDGHAMSNSQRYPTYILIFTTGNTVDSSTNKNKSDEWVRSRSIYELMHETAHQLGTNDHYCYGINQDTGICENNYCDRCVDKKNTFPFCVMNRPFNTEKYDTSELFCSECEGMIKEHLSDHH